MNDADPNDSFTVLAENDEQASDKALKELGWWVAQGEEVELDAAGNVIEE